MDALLDDHDYDATEDEDSTIQEDKQSGFVEILKKFPVLLNKSQIPSVVASKKSAIVKMLRDLEVTSGVKLTESQLTKKINNMKTAIRKKCDLNITGNRKIILLAWEKALLAMLQPETNPVFAKVPGAVSIGIKRLIPATVVTTASPVQSTCAQAPRPQSTVPPPPFVKRSKPSEALDHPSESDETKNLSTVQLHRLVLLKQLEYFNKKLAPTSE